MKSHVLLSVLILIVVMASCAPQPVANQITETQSSLATQSVATPSAETVIVTGGDEMVATDPATFSLASGGLQLVEFFSFT